MTGRTTVERKDSRAVEGRAPSCPSSVSSDTWRLDRRRCACEGGAVCPVRIRRPARSRDGAVQARTTRTATQRLRLRGVVVVGGAHPQDAWLGDELLARRPQRAGQPPRPATALRRFREQDGFTYTVLDPGS